MVTSRPVVPLNGPVSLSDVFSSVATIFTQTSVDNGFRYSINETVRTKFWPRCESVPPSLRLGLNAHSLVETRKSLVLMGGRKLRWSFHMSSLAGKCIQSLNVLCVCSDTYWRKELTSVPHVHLSPFRSKLKYSCIHDVY